jgi:hypothetical protein
LLEDGRDVKVIPGSIRWENAIKIVKYDRRTWDFNNGLLLIEDAASRKVIVEDIHGTRVGEYALNGKTTLTCAMFVGDRALLCMRKLESGARIQSEMVFWGIKTNGRREVIDVSEYREARYEKMLSRGMESDYYYESCLNGYSDSCLQGRHLFRYGKVLPKDSAVKVSVSSDGKTIAALIFGDLVLIRQDSNIAWTKRLLLRDAAFINRDQYIPRTRVSMNDDATKIIVHGLSHSFRMIDTKDGSVRDSLAKSALHWKSGIERFERFSRGYLTAKWDRFRKSGLWLGVYRSAFLNADTMKLDTSLCIDRDRIITGADEYCLGGKAGERYRLDRYFPFEKYIAVYGNGRVFVLRRSDLTTIGVVGSSPTKYFHWASRAFEQVSSKLLEAEN